MSNSTTPIRTEPENMENNKSSLETKQEEIKKETENEIINESNELAYFPVGDLQRLDEMLNRARWVVPVLPKNELETLLDASIALCRQGTDTKSEHCQKFFRDGLIVSFIKVLTDEAVTSWKYDIYKHIYNNSLKAVELCTLKLLDDWFPLLELLALLFNPQCKFHNANSMRPSELEIKISVQSPSSISKSIPRGSKKKLTNKNKKKTKKQINVKKENEQENNEFLIQNDDENDDDSDLVSLSDNNNSEEDLKKEQIVDIKNKNRLNSVDDRVNDDEDDDDICDEEEDDEEEDEEEDIYEEDEDDDNYENDDDDDADEEDDDDEDDEENNDNEDSDSKQKSKDINDVIFKNQLELQNSPNKQEEITKSPEDSKLSKPFALKKSNRKRSSLVKTKQTISPNSKTDVNQKKSKLKQHRRNQAKPKAKKNSSTTTYARSYSKEPYGWLVDFINHFGQLNGFKLLLERFTNNSKLNIQIIAALLKPWGLCYEYLTSYTVKNYFLPIIEIVPKFFENLTDEDIKKECKSESKNDSISTVIKWLKLLATRIQNQEDLCKNLEILRLKTILRILKFASFNGKMNALNEVNKVISNISNMSYNIQMRTSSSISGSSSSSSTRNDNEEEWLTSDRMAKWIQENDVLDIVLRDCMHQPQYVEKLEKILRFLTKEKALTLKDLDKIWESQVGKHEAIEKNVHDLLSKLAWDFTPEQLDHLFSCFQKSWTNASKKQREKLLDLIRSLSEDDKEGIMANKVLDLLWNLAHSEDAPTEIIDQAVAAHIKILDYSCSSDKESQKLKCLEKCIEQLKENKWVIVSMRQIREILQQYPEMIAGSFQTNRLLNYSQNNNSSILNNSNVLLMGNGGLNNSLSNNPLSHLNQYSPNSSQQNNQQSNCNANNVPSPSTLTTTAPLNNNNSTTVCCFYRPDIITKLQKEYSLISMITSNLANYYESIRNSIKETDKIDPETIQPDGRFNHITQIQERLNFMKYLLKEGQLWLCSSQAETIWKCLAQNSVFECDREICFKWFSKLMTDDPYLEPNMNKTFFVNYITKLDPKLLTDSGIKCYERFFKNVNLENKGLIQKRHYFLTESLDLIGLDYLWKIVTFANEDIVEKAILLLKDIYIHLGPQLKAEQSEIHGEFISNCMERLRVSYDSLKILNKSLELRSNTKLKKKEDEKQEDDDEKNDEFRSNQKITQILRVMIVLREYLNEFDTNYLYERFFPPLCRASKGKSVLIIVRFQVQNRQNEDIEHLSHTNETIGSLRRQIFFKGKFNPQINKIDLIINNECVECVDDNKILGEYQLKEKMFIIARVSQSTSGLGNNGGNNNSNLNSVMHGSNSASRLDSSADSSSDECGSGSEDTHNVINSPNIDYEQMLPSLILSLNEPYVQFLIELADFGCKINNAHIKECSRGILDLLPIAKHTADKIKQFCKDCILSQEHGTKAASSKASNSVLLDNLYFNCTQTQCWYFLKVTHALMMPAVVYCHQEEIKQFQENFILAGGVTCFRNMLVMEAFLPNADDNTKKAALLYVLKLNKLTMTTVCYAIYSYVLNAVSSKQVSQLSESLHNHALLIQNSSSSIPSNSNELTLIHLAKRLGAQFSSLLLSNLPDLSHILKLERYAWSLAANSSLGLVNSNTTYEQIHETLLANSKQQHDNDSNNTSSDDINVCREALECLSLSLCLVPHALELLNQEKHWRTFIIDLVLLCGNRSVRQTAGEQFLLIALKCSQQLTRPLQFFIQMLFTCLHSLSKEKHAQQSQEYFYLLCRLLNCAYVNNVQISNTETLLNNEIAWLKKTKQLFTLGINNITNNSINNTNNNTPINNGENDNSLIDEMLLDGHLGITKELLMFQTGEKKHSIGAELINDLIEYFIFPASYLFKKYRDALLNSSNAALTHFEQLLASKSLKSICSSSMTTVSAFDLLVSLCTGCLSNFKILSELLMQMFYPSLLSNNQQIPIRQTTSTAGGVLIDQLTNDCTIAQNEWEYIPPIGQRPYNGFVGLKNAGATCYMNSVLQQLFMIKSIRHFILSTETAGATVGSVQAQQNSQTQSKDVFDDLDEPTETSVASAPLLSEEEQRKEYNMSIFRHLQLIFGHLAESKMQFYVPKGFWRQFRFGGGERVNLREQHDAVEFFNSVVDCIDEAMKSCGGEQICSRVLGGTFADQKICKGCPHRYSREESFTLLSVDVKHSQRLSESLEQYVKGDLLEGPNAYHCEKCNKKIDAVKRTCIKKLPAVLAIQLKRFDYDWEREIAVKSNEYFEFPRELDMEPYTVKGVARIEKQEQSKRLQEKQSTTTPTVNSTTSPTVVVSPSLELNENDYEDEEEDEDDAAFYTNNYKLVGIVVHSGQANGGHYYSFIQNKVGTSFDENGEAKIVSDDLNVSNNESLDAAGLSGAAGSNNWYKFDDGEVSEFKMDDEELRNQCFGGDYTGEIYDNIMKRMAYKKQKRWWNAYILFYERIPKSAETIQDNENNSKPVKIPPFILKSVHKKNIKFLHHRHHFSMEYFQFIKKLCQANLFLCQGETALSDEVEDLCVASVQLAIKFLFGVGFRVKKTLRGPVNDWYEILSSYAKCSIKARQWMVHYFLIDNSIVVPQYFLDCPSNEIRSTISKLLVTLVHLSYGDAPLEVKLNEVLASQSTITVLVAANNSTYQKESEKTNRQIVSSDSLIQTVLSILSKKDLVNEQSSKYLIQYFQFFNMYSSIGIQQCFNLIRSEVPMILIQFALDELQTTNSNINLSMQSSQLSCSTSFSLNNIKMSNSIANHSNGTSSSQYADLTKLYCVVSTLLRCYDVSSYCASSGSNQLLPNPYSHYNELKLYHQQHSSIDSAFLNYGNVCIKFPAKIEEYLYKQSKYVKKLLEDAPNLDETVKLMKFLCWENMNFSGILLNELLWMVTYHYAYELKPHLEMLYNILTINDSWQTSRLMIAFQGIPSSKKDGLFEIIASSQNNFQKRGYQIIKMLVQLLTNCESAIDLLNKDDELKKKWRNSRNWFFNEMEKCRMYNMPNYTYFQSPQSNETSQTYYLERTQSARITLEKAMKIFPAAMNTNASTSNTSAQGNIEESQQLNDEQIDNEEEDAYESISDDDNLELRIKSNKSKENEKI